MNELVELREEIERLKAENEQLRGGPEKVIMGPEKSALKADMRAAAAQYFHQCQLDEGRKAKEAWPLVADLLASVQVLGHADFRFSKTPPENIPRLLRRKVPQEFHDFIRELFGPSTSLFNPPPTLGWSRPVDEDTCP